MTDDVSKQLDAVNSDLAKRLSGCEERLKNIIAEYQIWSKTELFAVLDQSTKAQVENSVRTYLDSNGIRLRAARAGLKALCGLTVPVAADPLEGFVLGEDEPPAPTVPQKPTVRLGMRDDPPDATVPDDDFVTVEAEAAPDPATTSTAPAGSNRGRPSPRTPQGSAAPVVADSDGFRRTTPGPTAGGRRKMASVEGERNLGGATVRTIGESEITTGERPSDVSIGEPVAGTESDLVTGRSMAPDADYEAAMRSTKDRQKKAIAAKSDSDDLVAEETEILDDAENLIGRATGVRRNGKQMIVDQIELFLENMPPFSSDEPALMVKEMMKARKMWKFHGSNKSFSAMIAHANRKGYDESDPNVLLLEDVGLAGGVKTVACGDNR